MAERVRDETTISVELDHLEAMGIGMALMAEQERDGLSEPQIEALEKIQHVIARHMQRLGMRS